MEKVNVALIHEHGRRLPDQCMSSVGGRGQGPSVPEIACECGIGSADVNVE